MPVMTQTTPAEPITGGTPALVFAATNAGGVAATFLRTDDQIAVFDATAPTTGAVGDAASVGTAAFAARRDHAHGREAFVAPAIVLGTAAAAGVATTPIRSDATIVAFDATAPVDQASADTAAAGTAAVAARRDHRHGMPTLAAAATQAEQEAGSSTTVYASPGRQQFHPSAAKAWCRSTDAGLLEAGSYNVSSITDLGVGDRTIVWDVDFSGTTYAAGAIQFQNASADQRHCIGSPAVGSIRQLVFDSLGVAADVASSILAFGDQ